MILKIAESDMDMWKIEYQDCASLKTCSPVNATSLFESAADCHNGGLIVFNEHELKQITTPVTVKKQKTLYLTDEMNEEDAFGETTTTYTFKTGRLIHLPLYGYWISSNIMKELLAAEY